MNKQWGQHNRRLRDYLLKNNLNINLIFNLNTKKKDLWLTYHSSWMCPVVLSKHGIGPRHKQISINKSMVRGKHCDYVLPCRRSLPGIWPACSIPFSLSTSARDEALAIAFWSTIHMINTTEKGQIQHSHGELPSFTSWDTNDVPHTLMASTSAWDGPAFFSVCTAAPGVNLKPYDHAG